MKIEDGDFRVRLTRKMLIEAFLQLRRQKPLRKITVSELCSLAGVGRGTFYAHFTDIYDLNEKLEDKFLADFSAALRGALEEKAGLQSTRRICRTVFALLEENEQLCQLLLAADNAGGAASSNWAGSSARSTIGRRSGTSRPRSSPIFTCLSLRGASHASGRGCAPRNARPSSSSPTR